MKQDYEFKKGKHTNEFWAGQRAGIRIVVSHARETISIGGWYDSMVDIPGANLPIGEFLEGMGLDKATASLLARIAALEKQVEAARAGGYQSGVEDAANFIQTNPGYFVYVGYGDRIAEDMRTMLVGVKTTTTD